MSYIIKFPNSGFHMIESSSVYVSIPPNTSLWTTIINPVFLNKDVRVSFNDTGYILSSLPTDTLSIQVTWFKNDSCILQIYEGRNTEILLLQVNYDCNDITRKLRLYIGEQSFLFERLEDLRQ